MKLIIVDDDHLARGLLREVIERNFPHARIVEFALAARALHAIGVSDVDLLITDYRMLDMDGDALTRAVRVRKPSLPIIMVSGSEDAEERGSNAGINRFISKNHLLTALPAAIRKLVNN